MASKTGNMPLILMPNNKSLETRCEGSNKGSTKSLSLFRMKLQAVTPTEHWSMRTPNHRQGHGAEEILSFMTAKKVSSSLEEKPTRTASTVSLLAKDSKPDPIMVTKVVFTAKSQ